MFQNARKTTALVLCLLLALANQVSAYSDVFQESAPPCSEHMQMADTIDTGIGMDSNAKHCEHDCACPTDCGTSPVLELGHPLVNLTMTTQQVRVPLNSALVSFHPASLYRPPIHH